MQIGTKAGWTAALLCLLLLSGCARIRAHEAIDTERSLAAAGFRMQFADTPEKQAELAKLPPRKLVSHPKDGEVVWVYGDPTGCKCLYVGSQAAYGRYQRMQQQELIATEEAQASMNWNTWGPWY